MKNSLDCKKLLSYGKELSIFAGILLVLLFVFSCNNILMRNSGSLIIALPGARAASASTFTIELTGSNGTTQSEPLAGGTTVQFDDLAPDTYTINVKGMDDAGTLVLSGTAKATVTAGQTATVTVDLKSSLGNLTVSFEGAESDSVAEYTVILSGPNESKETQKVTARTAQFEGLIPGDYTVSVEGKKNGSDVVVLAGTSSKVTVEAGKTATAKVPLQNLLGSLTVNFSGASVSTATSFTVKITHSEDKEFSKAEPISDGTSVQFEDLIPGGYDISVEGMDDSGAVVLYGTSSATVSAGATDSAPVNLVTVVNDFASLNNAVTAGGIVYIGSDINVASPLTVNTDVTLLPAYKNVTLTNNSSGNLFTVADSSGNLTIGGGEYSITLDGNQVAQSIISVSGGTATLADNGIITNAAASGIKISSSGTFEMTGGEISKNKESSTSYGGGGVTISGGTFNMTGGEISNNESSTYNGGGGITISGGVFNMTGGRIIDNTGSQSSGGVTVYSATFNMTGGTITDNTGSFGGAVSLVSGTFDMRGGSITGNTATDGGGVSVSGGNFNMSGSAVVDSNNDVYLITGKTINITSTLTGTTPVATITPASYASTQVLSAESGVDLVAEVSKFAVTPNPDGGLEWIIDTAGILQKGVSDFAGLQAAVADGGTVYVLKSIDVSSVLTVEKTVEILPAYQDVTLTNTGSGNLFTVGASGELTIGAGNHTITLDGNQSTSPIISMSGGTVYFNGGTITNANAAGVSLSPGTFNMDGGTIQNTTQGVNVQGGGTFTMKEGKITGNNGSSYGVGVTIGDGIFKMEGGEISNNTTSNYYGGGVAITSSAGTFNFSGGSIIANEANLAGKGVYVSGTFNMSGSAVVASDNDVFLTRGKVITVAGTLSGANTVATITLETSPYVAGTQVLSAGDGVTLTEDIVSKFAVTPDSDGNKWTIVVAETAAGQVGQLQQVQ